MRAARPITLGHVHVRNLFRIDEVAEGTNTTAYLVVESNNVLESGTLIGLYRFHIVAFQHQVVFPRWPRKSTPS
jgi:hypothetical protein